MNVFLWIVAGVLAAFFLAAGLTKLSQSKAALVVAIFRFGPKSF